MRDIPPKVNEGWNKGKAHVMINPLQLARMPPPPILKQPPYATPTLPARQQRFVPPTRLSERPTFVFREPLVHKGSLYNYKPDEVQSDNEAKGTEEGPEVTFEMVVDDLISRNLDETSSAARVPNVPRARLFTPDDEVS